MKVITVRGQIRDVASRYLEKSSRVVESDGRAERRFYGAWQEKIYNRLLALNVETATAADVAATAWVQVRDLPTKDGIHFSTAGVMTLGQRMAAAWLEIRE